RDLGVVRSIVAGERRAVGDLAVAVADLNRAGIRLEVVVVHAVSIAEDPDAVGAAEVVARYLVPVAMAERQLRARGIDEGVVPDRVRAGLDRQHLVLARAPDEQVALDDAEALRQAQSAQAETDRLGAVGSRPRAREVVEVVV